MYTVYTERELVVGALFAVANIGGLMNNASPSLSCTILGQLQRLFC